MIARDKGDSETGEQTCYDHTDFSKCQILTYAACSTFSSNQSLPDSSLREQTYQVQKVQTPVCLVSFLADCTSVRGKICEVLPKPTRLNVIRQVSIVSLDQRGYWLEETDFTK